MSSSGSKDITGSLNKMRSGFGFEPCSTNHVHGTKPPLLAITPLVLGTLLTLSGCIQTVLLKPEELRENSGDDIVVSIRDGRTINFSGEDYTIAEIDERQVIRGKGRIYREKGPQFETFEGDIPLDNVKKISTYEHTPIFYVAIVTASLAAGFIVFLAVALGGRGSGG